MNRTPPAAIRRLLRREVAFGCPVPDCCNPYLSYHHFDPPWHVREHHDPAGMIALCAEHHSKADAGAYSDDQLRLFKREGGQRNKAVRGRFDWMRRDLLIVLGGNFCYRSSLILAFDELPVVWIDRDAEGYMLLNIDMLTQSEEKRLRIEDNSWVCRGTPTDMESPPSGKLLSCKYANGDILRIEFVPLESPEAMVARYTNSDPAKWNLTFPITAVDVSAQIGGSGLAFSPKEIKTPANTTFGNGFMAACEPAFIISEKRPVGGFGVRLPWSSELRNLRRSSDNEIGLPRFTGPDIKETAHRDR